MLIEFLLRMILHPLSAMVGIEISGFYANIGKMCASFSLSVNVDTFMLHF